VSQISAYMRFKKQLLNSEYQVSCQENYVLRFFYNLDKISRKNLFLSFWG
jgi:hypothetical protein